MIVSRDKIQWKRAVILLPLFAATGAGIGICYLSDPAAHESYPLDDAWIHMVYARNTAQGHLFSFNPPDPEAGFSSPLWLLCMTVVHCFTQNVIIPKLVGLIFLILLAWTASRYAGAIAGLLILFDPWFQFAALSGMEVTGFAFLAVLALERQSRERAGQAGLAAAGALLMRPEGALLVPLLLVLALLPRSDRTVTGGSRGGWLRDAALLVGPALLAAVCWSAFCLAITGRPLPNTFYVKAQWGGSLFAEGITNGLSLIFADFYRLLFQSGPVFPLLAFLVLALSTFHRPDRRVLAAWILLAGLFIGARFTRQVDRIEAFYWARYFIPALAGLYLLAGLALQRLFAQPSMIRKGMALCLALALAVSLLAQMPRFTERYTLTCRDVARYNLAAGRWIAENTALDDEIAVHDAGAIRYFCKRHVVDLGGLNDWELTDLGSLESRLDITDSAALAAYLGADWLVLFERHFSGADDFTREIEIIYDDYSLYVIPERFALLLLKKVGL